MLLKYLFVPLPWFNMKTIRCSLLLTYFSRAEINSNKDHRKAYKTLHSVGNLVLDTFYYVFDSLVNDYYY